LTHRGHKFVISLSSIDFKSHGLSPEEYIYKKTLKLQRVEFLNLD